MVISSAGYEAGFFWFGLIQGGIVFVVAWFLRGPLAGEAKVAVSSVRVVQSARSFSPTEMLVTPTFWLLYLMFVLIAASGLMATAQIAVIAKNFGISNEVLFLGASTLTVALIVDNVLNGLARPFFGWISDQIGRENTMAIAFGAGGVAYWLLGTLGTNPWLFVLFAGLIFFTWGEIFSLFPSTCTDTFGPKFATVNTSFLYTAKGTSAFLVPLANVLKDYTGSWHSVFVVTAIANFVVVALALFVLRPMRARQQAAGDAAIGTHRAVAG
jgi:OFA family oxalate/formate antiporter-like MFS transporter